MLLPIGVIRFGERSAAVGNLHKAIEAIGLEVDPEERNAQYAGDSTAALVKRFQAQLNIEGDPDVMIDTKTADEMNRIIRDRAQTQPPVPDDPVHLIGGFRVDHHIRLALNV